MTIIFVTIISDPPHGACTFPLSVLAHTRSGDKGNSVNIGMLKYYIIKMVTNMVAASNKIQINAI